MVIRPLNDWVLIQQGEAEERSSGGIIIPEVAKEKPQWGIVVAAGPGAYKKEKEKGKEKEKRFIPTEVRPGDKVLYEKYRASEFEIDDQKIIMVREENILGTLESQMGNTTELQKKGSSELQKKGPTAVEKSGKKSKK